MVCAWVFMRGYIADDSPHNSIQRKRDHKEA